MINSGDTAFMLISAGLVLLMTPGLAFFYGGLVRRKNILSVLMQCFILMCAIGIEWVLFGYSLSFGHDVFGGLIGGFDWVGLRNVGMEPNPDYAPTIPHTSFMIFQAMFAVITPALIVGAFAERVKFGAFVFFIIFWSILVYNPVAHWVWGVGGLLRSHGALDFAGGVVVHITAGVSALVLSIMVGRRVGYPREPFTPHNLPFTVLGGSLLWFGWFGFNAGSALAANGIAANAFLTTNTATAAAGLTWAILDWKFNGAPTILGIVTGAVAGLVAITPACGFVGPMSAIIIGVVATVFCYTAVSKVKRRFGFDDSLDVFGVHGVGGICGTILTGLFAQKCINPSGNDGLFFGNPHQLFVQSMDAVICILYSGTITFLLFIITDKLIGMRVDGESEIIGLDLTQHRETAYTATD